MQLYRPNVAAIVLSSSYPEKKQLFVAERSDMEGIWQFPQGGIDGTETPQEALYRELKEEIGTKKVELIAEYPEWISYEFPEHAKEKMAPFLGQMQRYFLVRLIDDSKIKIDTKDAEFKDFKFVDLEVLFDMISHFKKPVYEQVIGHFKNEGYL